MNFFYSIILLVIQLQVSYTVWVGGFSKDFRQTRDQMLWVEKLWSSDRFQYFKLQAFYPVADHPNPTLKSIYFKYLHLSGYKQYLRGNAHE